ncbi:hypothetical protein GCM10009837_07400 [Streptomyces durmitorensis]|uniref:HNH endonuclease n=1 Tax=Streptomyces durmitorensis TaxID=319947 RepID=A0ABY4PKR3_9ACTN|nr:HNH endonuclease signature motif containing protein [Streptomyces durmitorensis]UQT54368.1 HNH endonuclease [Streptomyces durmitorensis]
MARKRPVLERLREKIVVSSAGCWLFTGRLSRDGYGRIYDEGKQREAYRVAYEQLIGLVPAGLELDHLCRVRRCVNPAHLEPVTPAVNKARANRVTASINERRAECKRGHALTPENTAYQNGGRRYCRPCKRITRRERQARQSST